MTSDASLSRIQFNVEANYDNKRSIVVSGDATSLGGFNLENAVPLVLAEQNKPDLWVSPWLVVPRDVPIRYRYALFEGSELVRWENVDGDRLMFPTEDRAAIKDVFDVVSDPKFIVPRSGLSEGNSMPQQSTLNISVATSTTVGYPKRTPHHFCGHPSKESEIYEEHEHAYMDEAEGKCVLTNAEEDDPHDAAQRALQAITGYSQRNEVADDVSSGTDIGTERSSKVTYGSVHKGRTSARVLQNLMVSRRYFVLSYHLPVILRCNQSGEWTAQWDTDSFLSRSEHSVAKYIECFWIGCVTRRCIDRVTPEEGARRRRSSGTLPPAARERSGLDEGTESSGDRATDDARDAQGISVDPVPVAPNMTDELRSLRHRSTSSAFNAEAAEDDKKDQKYRYQGIGSSPPGPQAFREPKEDALPSLEHLSETKGPGSYETDYARPEYGHFEDWIHLSEEDKKGIKTALKSLNVIPIFMDELGVSETTFQQFHQFLTMVLRPALHNVLDIGDEHSIFAMDANAPLGSKEGEPFSGGQEAERISLVSPKRVSGEQESQDNSAAVQMQKPHECLPSVRAAKLQRDGWKAYKAVNRGIARAVAEVHRPGDPVWTHDFQMCIVPKFLSQLCADIPQVFFMHAPFPTSEVFRTLPMREELLQGILESNVVGFHTFNHARHFLQCCKRVLGLNFQSRQGGRIGLDYHGRDVMVAISHVGVDVPKLKGWMDSHEAAYHAAHFRSAYPYKIIIAGFDTCERLSGIALKLLAFERLMEQNSRLREHVVLVQRCEIRDSQPSDYARTSKELKNLVSRICNAFGPVVDYAEAISYPPTYRIGLFHTADVLLQTPIREGLNLMPLEYVYARTTWSLNRDRMEKRRKTEGKEKGSSGTTSPRDQANQPDGVEHSNGEAPESLSSQYSKKVMDRSSDKGWGKKAIDALFRSLFPTIQNPNRTARRGKMATITEESSGQESLGGSTLDENTSKLTSTSLSSKDSPTGGDSSSGLGQVAPLLSPLEHSQNLRPVPSPKLPVPVVQQPLVAPLPPPERGGCVVLSEFSTACHILNSNILVNPWNIEEVTNAIDKALVLRDEERKFRQWRDYMYATRNPSAKWAREVLVDLLQECMSSGLGTFTEIEPSDIRTYSRRTTLGSSSRDEAESPQKQVEEELVSAVNPKKLHAGELLSLDTAHVTSAFKASKKRLIVLDYIRTLLNTEGIGTYVKHEFLSTALVKGSALTQHLADILKSVASDPDTEVFVITGSSRKLTEQMFLAEFPHVHLVAENGVAIYSRSAEDGSKKVWHETTDTPPERDQNWQNIKANVKEIMADYRWRVNGSEIHDCESVIAWDHRDSDPEWAEKQAQFLASDLETLVEAFSDRVKVTTRKARVEVSLRLASKGTLMHKIAEMVPDAEFVLTLGDDSTDEEMFMALKAIIGQNEQAKQGISAIGDAQGQGDRNEEQRSSWSHTFTVKVGRGRTHARYFLPSVADVHSLLVELSKCVPLSS
eukprot:gb/GECG01014652.1/.p1 GENE.gb/GECG01014652.1/~~gb/GECG01014652.1/.p1  ORF type:complete len:1488 (+),score=191.88 gb/GECG01014652.1/:1-4464(+)